MSEKTKASKSKLIASTLDSANGEGTAAAPLIAPDEISTEAKIGGGSFGTVYKGVCRGKTVAIKKLHQQALDKDVLEEFKKEVEIMTHLRHPNIVLFMGACTEPGHLAIVTELLPKGSLYDLLHDSKVELSLLQKLKFSRDIAMAMNWLHCSKPSIIHRDLKPTNVLVDENWNVKVCDFGLSTVKRQEQIKDEGVAPGTPLWMSPEVLRGKPLSEKADVYSFAIVMWEILTRQEPFEEHDSYSNFVRAVCDQKERPPLGADLHPSIRKILELCWHEEAEKRPDFSQIIEMLAESMVVASLDGDDEAQAMWRKYAKNQESLTYLAFAKALYLSLGLGSPDQTSTHYHCLQLLVASKDKRDQEESVSLEKFGLLLKWFGPLALKTSSGNIVDRVYATCKEEWFHGAIQREESEQKLATEKKGTYLVRLSTTEPEKSPFTISKVNQKGQINHQRVSSAGPGKGYFITIKFPDKTKKIEGTSMPDLIKKSSKDLYLKRDCSGSKFSLLFQKDDKVQGYLQDDD